MQYQGHRFSELYSFHFIPYITYPVCPSITLVFQFCLSVCLVLSAWHHSLSSHPFPFFFNYPPGTSVMGTGIRFGIRPVGNFDSTSNRRRDFNAFYWISKSVEKSTSIKRAIDVQRAIEISQYMRTRHVPRACR